MRVRGQGGDAAGASGTGVLPRQESARSSGVPESPRAASRTWLQVRDMKTHCFGLAALDPPSHPWTASGDNYVGLRLGVMVLLDHLQGTTRIIQPKVCGVPGPRDPATVVCP